MLHGASCASSEKAKNPSYRVFLMDHLLEGQSKSFAANAAQRDWLAPAKSRRASSKVK